MFQVTEPPANLDEVRLIAADMDNTLLDENGELPDGLLERVLDLRELGVTFAIASGRPLCTLQGLFPKLGPEIMLIGDNGGCICNRGEIIYQGDLPVEDYQRMYARTLSLGQIGMVCGVDATYFEERDRVHDDVFATFYYRREYVEDLTKLEVPADKYTIYLPDGTSREQAEQVYGPEFGDQYSVVSSGAVWVDIMPRGIDKGAAMRRAGEALDIPVESMMAFGDTFNDAAMLETVGFGYIVANASPGMERHASHVAPSNAEHGVLQVMDQVIEARRAVGN